MPCVAGEERTVIIRAVDAYGHATAVKESEDISVQIACGSQIIDGKPGCSSCHALSQLALTETL